MMVCVFGDKRAFDPHGLTQRVNLALYVPAIVLVCVIVIYLGAN